MPVGWFGRKYFFAEFIIFFADLSIVIPDFACYYVCDIVLKVSCCKIGGKGTDADLFSLIL